MGYRKVPTIFTVKPKEFDGLKVRLQSVKVGQMRKLMRLSATEDDNDIEMIDEMVSMITKYLVSWNLEDEDGNRIEPSAEAVDDLEFKMLSAIIDGWLDLMTGPGEDLGKGSPSGEQFPGQPATMEAL